MGDTRLSSKGKAAVDRVADIARAFIVAKAIKAQCTFTREGVVTFLVFLTSISDKKMKEKQLMEDKKLSLINKSNLTQTEINNKANGCLELSFQFEKSLFNLSLHF